MDKNNGLDWYPSKAAPPGQQALHRPFIYHIPKTGGTTLQVILTRAYDVLLSTLAKQGHKLPPLAIGRIETMDEATPEGLSKNYVLMSSHMPFPFHQQFASDFELVTIVREPFRRLVSSFTYSMARARRRPTLEDFSAFIADENNRNYQAKFLAGAPFEEPAQSTDAGARAWANLQEHFTYFGTTHHIQAIASRLLAQSSLPNVLAERLNKTRAVHPLDVSQFEQEALSLNAEDIELYERIAAAPRLGEMNEGDQRPPHPTTIVSYEAPESSSERFVGKSGIIATAQILPHIKNGKMPRAAFDQLLANATQGG